jgi:hypothetical protein
MRERHIYEGETHVSTLPCTYVREALRAMRARHACVRHVPHLCGESASRYEGETRMCQPCSAWMCR